MQRAAVRRRKKDHGRAEAFLIAAWGMGCTRPTPPATKRARKAAAAAAAAAAEEQEEDGARGAADRGSPSPMPVDDEGSNPARATAATASPPADVTSSTGSPPTLTSTSSSPDHGSTSSSAGAQEPGAPPGPDAPVDSHLSLPLLLGPVRQLTSTDGYGNPLPYLAGDQVRQGLRLRGGGGCRAACATGKPCVTRGAFTRADRCPTRAGRWLNARPTAVRHALRCPRCRPSRRSCPSRRACPSPGAASARAPQHPRSRRSRSVPQHQLAAA